MITREQIQDFTFQKFGFTVGQEIPSIDLWNHLIQNGCYKQMVDFLTIQIPEGLKESLISPDSITNSFFGPLKNNVSVRNQNKFLKKLRIVHSKIFQLTGMGGEEYELLKFYGNYWDENKKSWSKASWVLFSYKIP